VYIVMPAGELNRDNWSEKKRYLLSRGFLRLLTEDGPVRIDEFDPGRKKSNDIQVLIDRVKAEEGNRNRIVEAAELAYREMEGVVDVAGAGTDERSRFTDRPTCHVCGKIFEKPTPLLFSFNNPYGACPDCRGYGDRMEFSESLIVPDFEKSISGKAIDPWARERFEYFHELLTSYCRKAGIDTRLPYRELSGEDRRKILEGGGGFIGVIPFLEKMRKKSYKKGHRFFTRRYMAFSTCRTCSGRRLRKEAENVRIEGYSITDLSSMTPGAVLKIIEDLDLSPSEAVISRDLMNELTGRLRFMLEVGLDYLTLDRVSKTLSGGEAQRINLANSMGANLVDTVYILDEPSVGLHAADNDRLIGVMRNLKELGNTVIVVEHDPAIILSADHLVDLGPGPGSRGGEVVFSGSMEKARKAGTGRSKTLSALFGEKRGVKRKRERRDRNGSISLRGVREHNLKDLNLEIPLGNLVAVTGVSGSGKSSLVVDVLHKVLKGRKLSGSKIGGWKVDGAIDKTVLVDQRPIGSTPRSNPVTYIKGFSYIRDIFSQQPKSVSRGYKPGRFSFNKPEGRCGACRGMGYRRIEMHFMADVFVPCEICGGRRFNRETLEVTYKGKDISEILEMTVDEAVLFFDKNPSLGERLWILSEVGLGYLRLGQPSNTLSGGEAQRIKIAKELSESDDRKNVYILDEPTTGLHVSDIGVLLKVFDSLVDRGHTLVVIEHNMDVISWADWVIDLGPGGGDSGGRVVAEGVPEEITRTSGSVTGKYLKKRKLK